MFHRGGGRAKGVEERVLLKVWKLRNKKAWDVG